MPQSDVVLGSSLLKKKLKTRPKQCRFGPVSSAGALGFLFSPNAEISSSTRLMPPSPTTQKRKKKKREKKGVLVGCRMHLGELRRASRISVTSLHLPRGEAFSKGRGGARALSAPFILLRISFLIHLGIFPLFPFLFSLLIRL